MGRHKKPIDQSEFEDKSKKLIEMNMIFIVAKTYGAARDYVRRLDDKMFGETSFLYLTKETQLEQKYNRHNCVVVELTDAKDVWENQLLLKICTRRKLIILECEILILKQYAEVL